MTTFTASPPVEELRYGLLSSPIGDVIVVGKGHLLVQLLLPELDGSAKPDGFAASPRPKAWS